jgi:hypothetical protein
VDSFGDSPSVQIGRDVDYSARRTPRCYRLGVKSDPAVSAPSATGRGHDGHRGERGLTPRFGGVLVVTACLAGLLGGCGSNSEPAPTAPLSAASATVPTGLTPAPSTIPEQYDDGSTGTPLPGATLTLDRASRTSALTTGKQVMALFARRNVSADRWINDLSPYLTAQAAQAYQYVDPRNVPPTKITGQVKLTPASTSFVARVSVPTDAGVYLVILSRTDDSPTWLADRIMPPEGSGDS